MLTENELAVIAESLIAELQTVNWSLPKVDVFRDRLRKEFITRRGWKNSKAHMYKLSPRGERVGLWGARPNPPHDHSETYREDGFYVLLTQMYPSGEDLTKTYTEFAEKHGYSFEEVLDFPSWHYPKSCRMFVWREVNPNHAASLRLKQPYERTDYPWAYTR